MKSKIKSIIKAVSLAIFHFITFPLFVFRSHYKHYIFVLTTGRSGSTSLANIFKNSRQVNSFHEPYPIMYREFDVSNNVFNAWNSFLFYFVKYPAILKSHKKGNSVYLESNHLFIKTFSDQAVKVFGSKTKCIHLKRESYKVAKSMYEIGAVPGTSEGNIWYLNPFNEENLLSYSKITAHIKKEYLRDYEDFFKCLWYWHEIEERIEFFKKKYPDIEVMELKTSNLNNEKIISDKFSSELKIKLSIHNDIKILKENEKNKREHSKATHINLEEAKKLDDIFYRALEASSEFSGKLVI